MFNYKPERRLYEARVQLRVEDKVFSTDVVFTPEVVGVMDIPTLKATLKEKIFEVAKAAMEDVDRMKDWSEITPGREVGDWAVNRHEVFKGDRFKDDRYQF